MDRFSQQILKKPKNLKEHSLVAILGIYDRAEKVYTPSGMPYSISELAMNELTGKKQVFVQADSNVKLNKFKQDYPNAEIQEGGILENPDEWRVLAYGSENMPDESTPLDKYYQVRGRELAMVEEAKEKKENKK